MKFKALFDTSGTNNKNKETSSDKAPSHAGLGRAKTGLLNDNTLNVQNEQFDKVLLQNEDSRDSEFHKRRRTVGFKANEKVSKRLSEFEEHMEESVNDSSNCQSPPRE